MLLADVAATAAEVAATSSRSAKVGLIAALLRRLDPAEVEPVVGFLVGWPRQGRIGVGWSALSSASTGTGGAAEPTLEVLELDRAIAAIASTTGSGSAAARGALLRDLLGRATAGEADFIRRLLLGDMRQGALEGVVTDAVAKAAEVPLEDIRRAAMLSGNLGRTATVALTKGSDGLRELGLEIFRPVLPMLASTADDVAEALAGTGEASVEWKLDGVRIQVHRRGDEVRVYTRNLNDVTNRMPPVVEVARSLPVEAVVLDGEAIGLDEEMRPRLFQETMSGVGRHDGEADVLPFFFDILHADGRDLIDLPLVERAAVLKGVAGRHAIPSIVTDDAVQAQGFLDRALQAGHEGVMVKALSSTYQAGRRGKAWRKVKPALTLDLVVLGAEWGHGRRRGWLSNLHLGARDPNGGFVMVGKTFKGLTDELLRWQTEKLQTIEQRREGITVFVRPELVVEIELDGVQGSPRYPGGIALRFARVQRFRPDKTAAEADTIDTVRGLLPRSG